MKKIKREDIFDYICDGYEDGIKYITVCDKGNGCFIHRIKPWFDVSGGFWCHGSDGMERAYSTFIPINIDYDGESKDSLFVRGKL